MELDRLIPEKNNTSWIVKNNYLMYNKYQNIPLAFIEEDIVYIILENKLKKEVIKLTKHLTNEKIKFYFSIPEITNPSYLSKNKYDDEGHKNKVIHNYLYSYSQLKFYNGFNNINFDLIENLVKWCNENNCFYLIKNNYDKILRELNYKSYNLYTNKFEYDYASEIRNEFKSLYRKIRINQIL